MARMNNNVHQTVKPLLLKNIPVECMGTTLLTCEVIFPRQMSLIININKTDVPSI